ncbi:hypothetical protein PC129_g21517 [Phytophthora cactorum]|uniref:Uncharacterized protein n=1 Tax=Phytophthora cactorum TaxID=29920 RepID=A0A8T1JQ11_9STRA|nr:hypothetical protein Pcac1_g8611 [Phytophthora cactorum]KAG2796636.1 hypothetical protein PC112_g22118 [Phytophthora cactorum]KAG2875586.1 hypothetical protein PC114_g24632 [Phytophthora cactorum]KAG2878895.1 hypothetical protein PC115_g22942 [Phytophthora cactorum]KAG2890566.1 hypothetical protein PC117_g24438 [Phytophthora cactorum]
MPGGVRAVDPGAAGDRAGEAQAGGAHDGNARAGDARPGDARAEDAPALYRVAKHNIHDRLAAGARAGDLDFVSDDLDAELFAGDFDEDALEGWLGAADA